MENLSKRTKEQKKWWPCIEMTWQSDPRKDGGRGLASIEDGVDASIQQLEDYIEKRGKGLITATRNDTDNTKTNRMTMTKKQNWEESNSMGVLND